MGAEKYSGLIAGQKFSRRVEIAQRNREARGGLIRRDKNVVATLSVKRSSRCRRAWKLHMQLDM
ncbi:hypothetical protein YC2023_094374 [Brassica napus]